jgi:apolipoprotein N-acyltransferase
MVQGNVSMERKHDQNYFSVNREQYLKLSSAVAGKDTLVIWPESTITDFIPALIPHARNSQLVPFLGDGSAFLIGGLTYLSRTEFFNSSMLIRPDGSIAPPYHKIVLMPFGEYTPLGDIFPFIKEINSTAGQFTPGNRATALEFSLSDGSPVRVTPLICYEDIVPSLAREGVLRGGEVLVNQTNDAWFGDTVAASQHHMIATFRAIENRRFLLRSTNTGLTAVVDPVGRTLVALPSYSEGTLDMTVNLLSKTTIYTILGVERFWWWVGLASVLLAVFSRRGQRLAQKT